jgi:hypothetical protein
MVARKKQGGLTEEEKPIVKALLAKGWRNQDIQALVNTGREATINSGRITGVKQDVAIVAASDEEIEFFKIRKSSYDPKTGLNLFDHERLIRSREAMILAVQVFNSPALHFKSEVFTMLAHVAWTYLLHEHFERKKVKIVGKDGRTLLLSQMLDRQDCPLSKGMKDNLRTLKILRDDVEHKLLGRADTRWLGLFQACCLNFDKAICELFGSRLTLSHDLSFAIQFTRMNLEQLATLNRYEIPAHIDAIDARLTEGMTEAQIADLEYQFRVVYTLDAVTKSRAHFQFVSFSISWPTTFIPISRARLLPKFLRKLAKPLPPTITRRRGASSRHDPARGRLSQTTQSEPIAFITPPIRTILIRTNGLSCSSPRWATTRNSPS